MFGESLAFGLCVWFWGVVEPVVVMEWLRNRWCSEVGADKVYRGLAMDENKKIIGYAGLPRKVIFCFRNIC